MKSPLTSFDWGHPYRWDAVNIQNVGYHEKIDVLLGLASLHRECQSPVYPYNRVRVRRQLLLDWELLHGCLLSLAMLDGVGHAVP